MNGLHVSLIKVLQYICFLGMLMIAGYEGLATPALSSFTTGGHTVYHLQPGTVNGKRVVITAAYDGTVLCHTPEGALLWKTATGDGFPFDLAVADIDGDAGDETLMASGDGALYVLDDTGRLLWTFRREAPLYQVEVTTDRNGRPVILTGGVERVLFTLSPDGQETGHCQLDGVVRLIGAGNFKGDGGNYACVATARSGLGGTYTLRLHQLTDLKSLWEQPMSYSSRGHRGRYFSMEVFDFDGNARDEMVFGMDHGNAGNISVWDGEGNSRVINGGAAYSAFNWQAIHPGYEWKAGEGIGMLPYEMNLLCHAVSPAFPEGLLFDLYGNHLIVRDNKGIVMSDIEGPCAFAGIAFDRETGILYLGSDVSGGDGVYVLRPGQDGWERAFETMAPVGNMVRLQQNMELLLRQAESFQPPPWQPAADRCTITLQQSPQEIREQYTSRHTFDHVTFVTTYKYVERYDPGIADPAWRREWESQHNSTLTSREQILADVREHERKGEHFLLMGGHGQEFGIDFYISPETMIQVLRAAPNTFCGVVFAELETTDEAMARAVREQLLPLAGQFYEHGKKKILLRNKNIFWNGSIYLDFWKPALADPRFREVFVPSMEETNSRTQGLSLAGRTGLWLTGMVEHLSTRAVTDNANWSRAWEWGQTGRLSHMLRALCLGRVLGSDLLHINIYSENTLDLLPVYLLVEKGVLPRPQRDALLSVPDVAVGMTRPDPDFINHGTNGHWMAQYTVAEGPFVFDRLDCYWGGAPVPVHDFTRLAYGSRRRMLNFVPQFPFGLVPTISADAPTAGSPRFRTILKTDGRLWYDAAGNPQSAGAYMAEVRKTLADAATRLPVRVYGTVSWAAIRLDASHVRIILIDPGYLDPADHDADIVLQHLDGVRCLDILSGELLPVVDRSIHVRVPMGILRVVDIEHR